jgi:hypothetical protein
MYYVCTALQEKDALLRQVQDIDSKHGSRRVREGLWISKPVSSSCGRGIRVLTREKLLKALAKADKTKSAAPQKQVSGRCRAVLCCAALCCAALCCAALCCAVL